MSNVSHPSHYNQGKYEVIDVIYDWNLNFSLGNAIKYVARAGHKDPNKTVEDLQKAIQYIEFEIDHIKSLHGDKKVLTRTQLREKLEEEDF